MTEQHVLVVALLTSHEEGRRKGGLNKAYLFMYLNPKLKKKIQLIVAGCTLID